MFSQVSSGIEVLGNVIAKAMGMGTFATDAAVGKKLS